MKVEMVRNNVVITMDNGDKFTISDGGEIYKGLIVNKVSDDRNTIQIEPDSGNQIIIK